jgi:hypothetical protein
MKPGKPHSKAKPSAGSKPRPIITGTAVLFKKKRKKKNLKSQTDELGNKVYDIPKVNLSSPPKSIDLIRDKENSGQHLKECWRPDIYLNGDRSCNECRLYENCQCDLKRLVSETGRKVRNR